MRIESKDRRSVGFIAGLVAALWLAASYVYRRRARARVVGHEGLDDPAVSRAFDRIATLPPMRLLRWLLIRQAVRLQPSGRAADLGSGPGHLAIEMARAAPGLHVTGVDLSEEMLARAERRAARAGLHDRVAFKKGDVTRLPFPDGSLDLVVSTLSLHHWSDPVGVLDEIARVLRPGGSFVILDLRRELPAAFYVLLWTVTRCVVPRALRRVNEPLASRDAAFTLHEAANLAARSKLTGWRVIRGPLWLTIEGTVGFAAGSGGSTAGG